MTERLQRISKEIWLTLFYVGYVIAGIFVNNNTPSGPCTPGPGFALFILLIPVTLLIFVYHFFKYLRKDKEYWKCLLIDLLVWPMLILLSQCNSI